MYIVHVSNAASARKTTALDVQTKMSEHRQGGRGHRNNFKKPNQREILDETNPLIAAFRDYSKELDEKHDRYERITKLSRDITIESKRIIFLLHTTEPRKNNNIKVLGDAKIRLQKLLDVNFLALAKELDDQDFYQFRWAYSGGLQEFIEAYTFQQYLQGDEKIIDWNTLQENMIYNVAKEQKPGSNEKKEVDEEVKEANDTDKGSVSDKVEENILPGSGGEENFATYKFFVDPTEYILGVSDLTGELMRRSINSLGSGNTEVSFECCKCLQDFYKAYVGINVFRCKELSRKIYTMRQSVLKAENVCYNVKVRGGEAAKWGAVNSAYDSNKQDDVDEGFY